MLNENIIHHEHQVSKTQRAEIKGQKPCILWFTGLSGSGKSSIANEVELVLNKHSHHTYLLDGDNVRLGLNRGLGFSDEDRVENIRRVAEVSKLFVDAGTIVLTAFISPFRVDRELAKSLVPEDEFIEVFVDTPLEVCESRDPKGLYKKVRSGEIKNFTGVDSVYEKPLKPQIHLKADKMSIEESVREILEYLKKRGHFLC